MSSAPDLFEWLVGGVSDVWNQASAEVTIPVSFMTKSEYFYMLFASMCKLPSLSASNNSTFSNPKKKKNLCIWDWPMDLFYMFMNKKMYEEI